MRISLLPPARPGRSGATLTEVLMAILILSIGVSSVFALFPLAILQSIKATQLTNSKLMRENATEQVRTRWALTGRHVDSALAVNIGDAWAPRQSYTTGRIVFPTPKRGSFLPNPYRPFRAIVIDRRISTTNAVLAGVSHPALATEPEWTPTTLIVNSNPFQVVVDRRTVDPDNAGDTDLERIVVWEPIDNPVLVSLALGATPVINSWVIDPLGWATFRSDGTLQDNPAWPWPPSVFPHSAVREFGCRCPDTVGDEGRSVTTYGGWPQPLPRWNGTIQSVQTALETCSHEDTWAQDVTFVPLAIDTTAGEWLDLPPEVGLPPGGSRLVRLVVRNSTGTRSATRLIRSLSAPSRLEFPNHPLPASIVNDPGTASLESRDARYSWFVTVNNSVPGQPLIHVATVFQRKFLPGEEHVYRAVYGNLPGFASGGDTDVDDAWTAYGGGLGADQLLVVWNPATEPRPVMREGHFMFDPTPFGDGCQWYRITAVGGERDSGSHKAVIVSVDRPVQNRSATVVGRAMFMRGLVEVYRQ